MDRIINKIIKVLIDIGGLNPSANRLLQLFSAYSSSGERTHFSHTGEVCPKTTGELGGLRYGRSSYVRAHTKRMVRTYKNIIILLSVLCAFSTLRVYADVPVGKIAYQGRLTDTANTPLSGSYNFTFKIFDASSGGNLLWSETQNSVSVDNGLLTVNLGDSSIIPGTIFNSAATYLEITVNTDSAMTPRIRLLTAPYAFNSQTLQGYDFAAFVTTFSAQTISGNKTFTGPVTSTSGFKGGSLVSLITADEVDSSSTTNTVTDTVLKSFTLPANDFGTIIVETEVKGFMFQDAAALCDFHWKIMEGATVRKDFLWRLLSTTAGTAGAPQSQAQSATLKTSFPGGQASNTTLEIRGQMGTANAGNGILAHSFRVYGVR